MSKSPPTPLRPSPAVYLLALGMLLTSASVTAQVIRCVDPGNGQISYTDGACSKGAGTTIAPARSAAEVTQEDERAQAARQRWQAEQLHQRPATPAASAGPSTATASSTTQRHNQACQAAQDELQALSRSSSSTAAVDAAQRQMEMQCLGPEGYAALERSRANALAPGETTVVLPPHHARPPAHRPPPPQEPIQRLNCNVFRCFDQNGNAMPAPRPGEIR